MADTVVENLDEELDLENEFDMEVCVFHAEAALETLQELEGQVELYDFTGAVYSLFVNCIRILADNGWSERELMSEVFEHAKSPPDMLH